MENQDDKKNFKAPGNEDYDINRPQNIAKPAFNSTSGNRKSDGAPPVENLNHQNDEDDQLQKPTANSDEGHGEANDERLRGNRQETDLGNSEDRDDPEDEKLIRT